MAVKNEPTKIFFDVLSDYWDLKYIFEYGFYWDDKATEVLLGKSSQKPRELEKILKEAIYAHCAAAPWWMYTAGDKAKKSQRRLLRNNHYRRDLGQWFQELYTCYGMFNQLGAQEYVDKCEKRPYTACLDENETCAYRRICQIQEMADVFAELSENGIKGTDWTENKVKREIMDAYGDVIVKDQLENRQERWRLKENTWTRENFIVQEEFAEFKDEKVYEAFTNMLRFFAGFAPLSVLGVNFLRHSGVSKVEQSFALIRNLTPNYCLEQEYLYRVLYAQSNRLSVLYEEQNYIPLRIRYLDKNINGLLEHPYLEAMKVGNDIIQDEKCLLPLYTGAYLKQGKRIEYGPVAGTDDDRQEFVLCEVDFFYNRNTPYLLERRKEGWKAEVIESRELEQEFLFESPYYPGENKWRADRVKFQIKGGDYEGFLLFIASFGEFARLYSTSRKAAENMVTDPPTHLPIRGKIREYESLLSIYNSQLLKERIHGSLPPREAELEWLLFILNNYPNMCRMFLDDKLLEKLRLKAMREQKSVGWFDNVRYEFQYRVADIQRHESEKYKRILEAIQEKKVLSYEHKDKLVHIFPYALEYDVTRHLTGRKRAPLDIMCYSLDEMRTVKILYKDIVTKEAMPRTEVQFSETEKLFHVLVYGIRCADREVEWDNLNCSKAKQVFEACWKSAPKYNDNYTRCIKRKYKSIMKNKAERPQEDYRRIYESAKQMVNNYDIEEDNSFLENVFGYYYEISCGEERNAHGLISEFQWKFYTFLLKIFLEGYKTLKNPANGVKLSSALMEVSASDIWNLICGDDVDEADNDIGMSGRVENEIVFYNERFQNAEVSFILKECTEQNIDLVYRLFGSFICVGEFLPDNQLQFTVTYEKFDYRKIHMLLMTIAPVIEKIRPEQTAIVIEKRLRNKEILRNE